MSLPLRRVKRAKRFTAALGAAILGAAIFAAPAARANEAETFAFLQSMKGQVKPPPIAPAPPADQSDALMKWRALAQAQTEQARPKIDPAVGVNELVAAPIGGIDQYIHMRGLDRANPVLLFLHGGPGAPLMAEQSFFQPPLEAHFTIVHWDQRCAGKTYFSGLGKVDCEAVDVDRMIADAKEVVAYVKKRLGKEKIILVGHSWGTILGTTLVHDRPRDFHAYVGVGQAVDLLETADVVRAALTEEAARRGDGETLRKLREAPRSDTNAWAGRLEIMRIAQAYGRNYVSDVYPSYGAMAVDAAMRSPEYSLQDTTFFTSPDIALSLRTMAQLQSYGVARLGTRYKTPMVIAMGALDLNTPTVLARRYFDSLEAPKKIWHEFPKAAHNPMLEQPEAFNAFLIDVVRPLAGKTK